MAKTKVSEWSAIPANNTDVGGIDINEGCAPSGINNAIREVMSQVKDMQAGIDGDSFTVGGNLSVTGTATLGNELIANGSAGTAGQFLTSRGAGLSPQYTTLTAFVSGMIMLWSGSSASIPSGWLLCDGSSSTPDLRNRFVVGAGSTYAVNATGGSADAIVVAHTHSITDSGHFHNNNAGVQAGGGGGVVSAPPQSVGAGSTNTSTATTGISINSTGSSGTNANLPPYYALCYIMKS
jgi:microcystin-dependent protein